MLFPKVVPSCSQSWALFCIWNVRNALLHSLSHLDTLTCKGGKEHENTAGARRHLQRISFYCHCHLSQGVSWAVAAAQPHAGSEQLPASPRLSRRAEVALTPCEGVQLTPVLQGELSQLCPVQPDLLTKAPPPTPCPALVPPQGPPLTWALFRATAE